MLLSIVQVVLVPIALGFVINAVASKVAQACSKVLPLVSVIAISLIIMAVVSANAAKLATVGALIIVVVMLHNICGYALGYFVGRALGLSKAQMRTLSIEVGMQNSGLATSLATMHFASHAAGRRARRRVQRVAQHLRRHLRQHPGPHRRQGREGGRITPQRRTSASPFA